MKLVGFEESLLFALTDDYIHNSSVFLTPEQL